MRDNFARILKLLRKERNISQKQAAESLGISQALLSHYENNIRECGLEFVVRVADFYAVSCDYLLGRTPDRTGAQLTVEDIPEPSSQGKENIFKGSVLPTLNKKLIANSLNIIFDYLQKVDNKTLTTEVSYFLMLAVYRAFHLLYTANEKNPLGMFVTPAYLSPSVASAEMQVAEAKARALASGKSVGNHFGIKDREVLAMSPELLSSNYPLFSSSLLNLIQNVEQRMKREEEK